MQELGVLLVVALALGYLVARAVRRRASGNCCGQDECPAARETLRRLRTRR